MPSEVSGTPAGPPVTGPSLGADLLADHDLPANGPASGLLLVPAAPRMRAKAEELRRRNLGDVLRHVHLRGSIARAELTRQLALNRSTIAALSADLIRAGLVQENPPASAGRAGRPSFILRPRVEQAYVVAVHVTARQAVVARVGLGGTVLQRVTKDRVEPHGSRRDDAAGMVSDLARSDGTARCVGIGVAVGQDLARVRSPDLEAPPLLATAWHSGQMPGTPTVGTEAELGAVAEHLRGVARDRNDIIFLHGGAGPITTGVILDGRLLAGHSRHTSAVGHMVVNPGGRVCSCGSQGCWEAEVRACWEAGAHGGCPDRQAQLSHWLALGIANLVNIFNPEMVVLGGGFGEVYPRIASLLATECAGFVVPPYRTGWRLVASSLGRDAPLVGAAEVAFAKLFTDPLRASAVPPACKTLLPIRRSGCEGEFQA